MEASRRSVFSWDSNIHDGDRQLCRIDQSWFRKFRSFELDGICLVLGRESGWTQF